MAEKHTGAPWHVEDHAYDNSMVAIVDDCGTTLAAVEKWNGDEDVELMAQAAANAKLMAAAPDLLAACSLALAVEQQAWPEGSTLAEVLRAAINKATGE